MTDQIPDQIAAMAALEAKARLKGYQYSAEAAGQARCGYSGYLHGCLRNRHAHDRQQLGLSRYPLVPGHEVVGHVIAVGSDVKNLKVGDVVGLGAQAQACGECEFCKEGI
jgi:hypothetical protein